MPNAIVKHGKESLLKLSNAELIDRLIEAEKTNITTLGENEIFYRGDNPKHIMIYKDINLTVKNQEIQVINGSPMITAKGTDVIAPIIGLHIAYPPMFLDGKEVSNPYTIADKNGIAKTIKIKMVGWCQNPLGNIITTSYVLDYDIYTYFIRDINKKVAKHKGCGEIGTRDLKKPSPWTFLPTLIVGDSELGIWVNLSNREILDTFNQNTDRTGWALRNAQGICGRNLTWKVIGTKTLKNLRRIAGKNGEPDIVGGTVRVYGYTSNLTAMQVSKMNQKIVNNYSDPNSDGDTAGLEKGASKGNYADVIDIEAEEETEPDQKDDDIVTDDSEPETTETKEPAPTPKEVKVEKKKVVSVLQKVKEQKKEEPKYDREKLLEALKNYQSKYKDFFIFVGDFRVKEGIRGQFPNTYKDEELNKLIEYIKKNSKKPKQEKGKPESDREKSLKVLKAAQSDKMFFEKLTIFKKMANKTGTFPNDFTDQQLLELISFISKKESTSKSTDKDTKALILECQENNDKIKELLSGSNKEFWKIVSEVQLKQNIRGKFPDDFMDSELSLVATKTNELIKGIEVGLERDGLS